jgi:serine/threonine protein phosphatase PrpC
MDEAYVKRKVIKDKHTHLIIASDGLYDNISDDKELSLYMINNIGMLHSLANLFV